MPNSAKNKVVRINDDALRQFTGYSMKRAFNAIQSDVTRTLAPFGLRMITFSALAMISDNEGLSQSQLAAGLAIERPNLVVIIDELERRDLISRERVPTDRRTYALQLTPEGVALLATASEALLEHEARMMREVAPEDMANMLAALRLIENANTKAETGRTG
ncbi:MAG: MarR family winged helix-turn-helix transcriptional regulator [Maritimibacter sp.]